MTLSLYLVLCHFYMQTPQKDYCIFVIGREPELDFFKMVYFVYRGRFFTLQFSLMSDAFH